MRPSTSQFVRIKLDVSDGFEAKHVMVSNRAVEDIPFNSILKRFNAIKDLFPYFINYQHWKNTRTRHTFIVTTDLEVFKTDLKNEYANVNEDLNPEQLTDINITKLAHQVGLINFNVKFNKYEHKYDVLKHTCEYSYKGTLVLGSKEWTEINLIIHEINHLQWVDLPQTVKKCKMPLSRSLPRGTCGNKKTDEKKN